MAHPSGVKEQATLLRLEGFSLRHIARVCGISLSTASTWLSDVVLSPSAQRALLDARASGVEALRAYFAHKDSEVATAAFADARRILADPILREAMLMLTTLWWCEGTKSLRNGVRFTNADAVTIQLFMRFFRQVFELDNSRLRGVLHLHEYHNAEQQIIFWSALSGIPSTQFSRPYIKPHTGKRKKPDYPGCFTVRYSDAYLARVLKASWDIISMSTPGV